jgi:predicted DCC family thiol-disulfide oxidoreductase YuxK
VDESWVLIYDGDCQFCQLSLDFGIKNLRIFPQYVAFQKIDPKTFGLTAQQVRSQIWLAQRSPASAAALGGHLAAGAILKLQPSRILRLLGWLASTPPTSWAADLLYKLIAANRHRLPGGSRACKIEDNYLPYGNKFN